MGDDEVFGMLRDAIHNWKSQFDSDEQGAKELQRVINQAENKEIVSQTSLKILKADAVEVGSPAKQVIEKLATKNTFDKNIDNNNEDDDISDDGEMQKVKTDKLKERMRRTD